MWPRRKVQLAVSPTAVGIEGVRAILNEIRLEYTEVDLTGGDSVQEAGGNWPEQSLEWGIGEPAPVTELVFWPEVSEDNFWRVRASAQGLKQQSIQAFLHSIFEDELLLGVSEPTVLIEGRPMLGHILDQAGFEPSILWPAANGEWQAHRKQGVHWVLPDFWLEGLVEVSSLGREVRRAEEKSTWLIRESGLDFYRDSEGRKFVGRLPRWPERAAEQAACQNIAKCLDLGVSWLDITLALGFLWENIISTDNLRWNTNDFGWNGGTSGERLSAASVNHVEDWWSG